LEGEERKQVLSVIETALEKRPALPDYHHLKSAALEAMEK
jgi:hypothetical protein